MWNYLLSGGLIVAIISMAYNFFLSKRTARISYLREQLDKFYAPLFFLHFQKEVLHKLCNEVVASKQRGEISFDFALYNEYQRELICHIKELKCVIETTMQNNFSLIDIEDIDEFMSGIKALKVICSYHDEHDKKENRVQLHKRVKSAIPMLPAT